MKDKRFVFGLVVTLVWLAVVVFMLCTQELPAALNAWGDFFAGIFAPLAFLWLVLGYRQQGDELKQSTKALKLQAQELRHSVEQQTALVAVSREQVHQERLAFEEERELRRDAARPKFVPQNTGSTSGPRGLSHQVKIVNVGNTATHVVISFDPPLQEGKGRLMPVVTRGGEFDINLRLAEPSVATIAYVDADGQAGEVRFSIQVGKKQSQLAFGKVERVL